VVSFSEQAANEGKIVIISCLDGTFKREGFGLIMELIPLAEKVKKLAAICRNCSYNASFSFRTAISDQVELIGGESMYKPLCRECFITETKRQEKQKNTP
jgi:thymidine kinase